MLRLPPRDSAAGFRVMPLASQCIGVVWIATVRVPSWMASKRTDSRPRPSAFSDGVASVTVPCATAPASRIDSPLIITGARNTASTLS